MEQLIELVSQHKFSRNGFRTNLDNNPENFNFDKAGRKWLKKGPFSNSIREGPILRHVQTMFPEATAVCLNRKSCNSPPMAKHKDRKNVGDSYIAFWGDYENGGELVLEDGRVFSDKHVFHGPYNGAEIAHEVKPHKTGTRYSAVIFSGPKIYPKHKPAFNQLETL